MSKVRPEKRGLGRGLSALMADVGVDSASNAVPASGETQIPVEQISPNPNQPRRLFVEENLDELAASIRERGIIQPLILRPDPERAEHYQIVAGERRWRAAQRAQLHTVPALVRSLDDTETLQVAIIENIQRADLNAIDEAASYKQLMDRHGHTQDAVATALGKSRPHIANLLRLLNLPDAVQQMVARGDLSAGHARALITADDPTALAALVVAKKLSVRETEKLAKQHGQPKKPQAAKAGKDADTRALEQDLSANLSMSVSVDHSEVDQSGKVTISYKSLEELDNICKILSTPM